MTANERSLLAQLRIGILPIRVETGIFVNLAVKERVCQICKSQEVEDELHFLFNCPKYNTRGKFL